MICCINRNYSSYSLDPSEFLINYSLHSMISFEPILSTNEEEINHYITLAFNNNGYFIYDDLLTLDGEWQGGFVSKKESCYIPNLKQFKVYVPIFILKPN